MQAEFRARHARPAVGPALVVGSRIYPGREDWRGWLPEARGLDMQAGDGVDIVWNLERPLPHDGVFAHVECLSVLEHTPRPWCVARNIERLLRPGGTLFLSVPFVWRVHGYPSDYWRFTAAGVRALFPRIRWEVVRYGHRELEDDGKRPFPVVKVDGLPFLGRSEVLGFGVRL